MKKIFFENDNGVRLCGYVYERKTDRAVILCHGFTGDKSEHRRFEMAADAFCRRGFAAFRFDFAGSGESEDYPISVSSEAIDLGCAIRYMKGRGYTKLGLLGLSLGGLVVLKAKSALVKAICLWAPLTRSNLLTKVLWSNRQLAKYELGNIGEVFRLVLTGTGLVRKKMRWRKVLVVSRKLLFDMLAINQEKLLSSINLPVLIVHGEKDTKIPVENSEIGMRFLNKDSRLVIIKGADHEFLGYEDKFIKPTVEWFVKNLK